LKNKAVAQKKRKDRIVIYFVNIPIDSASSRKSIAIYACYLLTG